MKELVQAIAQATGLDVTAVERALVPSQNPEHGDFAFPCFLLAKQWKVAPPEGAKRLAETIVLPPSIAKVQVVGPYANFFLDRAAQAVSVVKDTLAAGAKIGAGPKTGDRVVLDYGGPNTSKPYHVGHLRNLIIGSALDRILRLNGTDVIAVSHLGDWGTQFGFVYVGCELYGYPKDPTVEDLVVVYQKASRLKKAQEEGNVPPEDADKPDANKMARDYFIRLEAGDAKAREFWQWCLDISMQHITAVDKRLHCRFDHYTGESFYFDKMQDVEQTLKESGILKEDKGAKGVDLGEKLGFARIFAEDGRSLYLTRDLAAVDYRAKTFHPNKLLYVVGAQQTLHFKQLMAISELVKHPMAGKIVHIAYGFVPGISTRNTTDINKITIEALLDDAEERALEAYRTQVSKRPENLDEEAVAKAVGTGAVVFEYISRSSTKDFNFKWEDALSFTGDAGPYIQYAVARLNSIEAKARESGITVTDDALSDPAAAKTLAEPDAYQLVAHLARFRSAIEKSAAEYEPSHVALYTLQLAKLFSGVYKTLRVVGEEPSVARVRLALFMATREVLKQGLSLIGVPVIERM